MSAWIKSDGKPVRRFKALLRRARTGTPAKELLHARPAQGLRTLRQDGILKLLQDITPLAEVRSTSTA